MIPVRCDGCGERVMAWDTERVWVDHEVIDLCFSCAERERPVKAFSHPEDGSEKRYEERRGQRPWLSHTFWWLVHNCVAHPLIGFIPIKRTFQFHDWTSRRMHGLDG